MASAKMNGSGISGWMIEWREMGFVRLFYSDLSKAGSTIMRSFLPIVVPQAERVSPGLAVRCCGKTMAFWAKDGGGLVMDG